jgi:hypothetical protein
VPRSGPLRRAPELACMPSRLASGSHLRKGEGRREAATGAAHQVAPG